MRAKPVLVAFPVLVLLLAGGTAVGVTSGGGRAEIGTVETIAGPGFCKGGSTLDRQSNAVRALAVGSGGELYVDTGPPTQGRIAHVNGDGEADLLDPEIPGATDGSAPSRLAADVGGVLVAAGDKVVAFDEADEAATVVAGDPDTPPANPGPGPTGDGGPARSARFAAVKSVASDEVGNVYVADQLDAAAATVRVRFVNRSDEPVTFYPGTPQALTVAPGHIDTITGVSGRANSGDANSGDGGPARLATLQGGPPAMATATGRLYIALSGAAPGSPRDQAGVRMINLSGRQITAHGVSVAPGAVETVAGGGPAGFAGDGGPARSAAFSAVPGISADAKGNLFLADQAHHRVRKVDAAGTITTLAGTGGTDPDAGGFNGNDRPANDARLNQPHDVKAGPGGRIYISDRRNDQVRYVDEAGFIHAAPGNGLGLTWACARGVGTPGDAPVTQSGGLASVAADDEGNVYVATSSLRQIKRLDPSGTVISTAGSSGAGSSGGTSGEGEPAPGSLGAPVDLALRPDGGLYVLDADKPRVRFLNLGPRPVTVHGVDVAPGAERTVAGTGIPGGAGDGGRSLAAQLSGRGSVEADARGNLLIADGDNASVRQVDPAGTIATVVGPGAQGRPDECCGRPSGLAVDGAGNLYVSDGDANRVWFVNRGPVPVTVHDRSVAPGARVPVVGTGTRGSGGDGGPAAVAELGNPAGLALDGQGTLYIGDLGEDTVRRVDAKGTITTVAGTGTASLNGDRLKGRSTALSFPNDLAVDPCGNLLIADDGNDRVRRLNLVPACNRQAPPPAPARGRVIWLLGALGVLGATAGGFVALRLARR